MNPKFVLVFLCGIVTAQVLAQTGEHLPAASAYKGEIRRGADGRLIVEPALAERPAAAKEMAARPATMRVGPQEKIRTLTEAARLARDGEVIEIRAGEYRGQPAIWAKSNLTIRAVGERAVMVADGMSAEGKAIWVVRGNNVQIENIEFRGARVPSANGAGIRFEQGSLEVRRCAFFDNEMGILTANRPEMTLAVVDSEFGDAPQHEGGWHHLLYVGAIGKLTVSGSRFQKGHLGHLLKSRARENHIFYNRLVDGPAGRASYELEFPNGGIAYVVGNLIGQSARTDNPAMLAFGAEGPRWEENALYLAHNTLINDAPTGSFVKVWAERFADGVDVWAINNVTVGYGDLERPAQGRFEGNHAVLRNELIDDGGGPARLTSHSPLRGRARMPGLARGVDLLPQAENVFPVGTRPIRAGSSLAPGAFQ